MNKTEYLLTTISAECSEVIKESSKCLRFGLYKYNPKDRNSKKNVEALIDEVNDIRARTKILCEYLHIPYNDDQIENFEFRKNKLAMNMEKSEKLGRLQLVCSRVRR